MSENNQELEKKIEAILFAYGDWVSIDEIKDSVHENSSKKVENSLSSLEKKYNSNFPFSVIQNENNLWKMTLDEDYEEVVTNLVSGIEIPKNVLKVLSVIAYEQPVSKTRLSEILGRSVKQEVDYLYKAKFVDYEKRGIGRYYRVTKKFFDYFKVEDEENFRKQANEKLNTFLEDPSIESESQEIQTEENKS